MKTFGNTRLLNTLVGILVCAFASLTALSEPDAGLYREQYRPQYHFSPPRNWMNDPNGLVYFSGEFHLFYQYNPFGNTWGHMSWGHAVSPDLVTWKHLPVAIPERGKLMAFSGSAVVDWGNTTGWGTGSEPALVAIYTGHESTPQHQAQYIAYSNDHGRTWRSYANNPVVDRHTTDFRDPKVFWYAPGGYWVMTVALPKEHKVAFYRAPDLKHWELLSEFGPAGCDAGVWECPDMFDLPVHGTVGTRKWVLTVNVGNGAPNGGTGCQYFVGAFDGTQFVPDSTHLGARWADFGRDFYAAVSWSDVPATDGRRLWIGWMNNWNYGRDVPTTPWRGAFTLVRELALAPHGDELRLIQTPIPEYDKLRVDPVEIRGGKIEPGYHDLAGRKVTGDVTEIKALIDPRSTTEVGFTIFDDGAHLTKVGYDPRRRTLFIDRHNRAGAMIPKFVGRDEAPFDCDGALLELHMFLDRSSIEIFAGDGRTVLTDQVFPSSDGNRIGVYAIGGAAKLVELQAWTLNSVWSANPKP